MMLRSREKGIIFLKDFGMNIFQEEKENGEKSINE
jgi:hypothetical protein